jgi:RNA polymerase sigma factor (sigma-70 family)
MQGSKADETAHDRELDPRESSRDLWLSRFVDEHGASAYRTAYRLLRDRNDAHDAVQDALARAFQRWDQLHSVTVARAWFFRILVNSCISRQRRRRVRERALQLLGLDPKESSRDPSIAMDVSDRILPHLLRLPIKQRSALILRFGDDRSIDEIATAMNIGAESVKTHLKRGLAALRKHVQAAPGRIPDEH